MLPSMFRSRIRYFHAILLRIIRDSILIPLTSTLLLRSVRGVYVSPRTLRLFAARAGVPHETDYVYSRVYGLGIIQKHNGSQIAQSSRHFQARAYENAYKEVIIAVAPFASQYYRSIPALTLRRMLDDIMMSVAGDVECQFVLIGTFDLRDKDSQRLYKEYIGLGVISQDYVNKTMVGGFNDVISSAQYVVCCDSLGLHLAIYHQKSVYVFAGGGHFTRFVDYGSAQFYGGKPPDLNIYIDKRFEACFNCNWICGQSQIYSCTQRK